MQHQYTTLRGTAEQNAEPPVQKIYREMASIRDDEENGGGRNQQERQNKEEVPKASPEGWWKVAGMAGGGAGGVHVLGRAPYTHTLRAFRPSDPCAAQRIRKVVLLTLLPRHNVRALMPQLATR